MRQDRGGWRIGEPNRGACRQYRGALVNNSQTRGLKSSGVAERPARPILFAEAIVGSLGQAADRLGPRGCFVLLPTRDQMRLAFEAQRNLALVVVYVSELLELAIHIHRRSEIRYVHGDGALDVDLVVLCPAR